MKYLVSVLSLAALASGAPNVFASVRDGETKLPLVGAVVMSEGSDIMAVTDSSGRCLLVVAPKRRGALVASRSGYQEQALTGAWPAKHAQDTAVVEFLLYRQRPAAATIPATGADASLVVSGAGLQNPAPPGPVRSDSGQKSPGSAAATPEPVHSPVADPSLARVVEVKRTAGVEASRSPAGTASVEGTVFDAGTGLPVRGARIGVEGTGSQAVSDSAGFYTLDYVSAGTHKLLVGCPGYTDAYTVVRLVKNWSVTANLYLRQACAGSAPGR